MSCRHESDIVRAAQSQRWSAELRTHAASCPSCRELTLVAGALSVERRRHSDGPPVADAGLVWWKARLQARHRARERATRPIAVAEILAMLCLPILGVAAAAQFIPALSAILPSAQNGVLSSLSGLGLPLLLASAGGVVALLLRSVSGLVQR